MSRNLIIPSLAIVALLSACAPPKPVGTHRYDKVRLGPGDITDAATTAYGINTGLVEGNPLLKGAAHGGAGAVAVLGVKYGFKQVAVHGFDLTPAKANVNVESVGVGATCWNVVSITGGEPALSALAGLACLIANRIYMTKTYERETGKTLDGTVIADMPLIVKRNRR